MDTYSESKVQYMLLYISIHSLVADFELGNVGSAHRAVGFLGLVLVDGRKCLDTRPTERVVAVRNNGIGSGNGIEAERAVALRSVFGDIVGVNQDNFLEIYRGAFHHWSWLGGRRIINHRQPKLVGN